MTGADAKAAQQLAAVLESGNNLSVIYPPPLTVLLPYTPENAGANSLYPLPPSLLPSSPLLISYVLSTNHYPLSHYSLPPRCGCADWTSVRAPYPTTSLPPSPPTFLSHPLPHYNTTPYLLYYLHRCRCVDRTSVRVGSWYSSTRRFSSRSKVTPLCYFLPLTPPYHTNNIYPLISAQRKVTPLPGHL